MSASQDELQTKYEVQPAYERAEVSRLLAEIDRLKAQLAADAETIDHWRAKAKCYGDIVHACSPALTKAGFPVDDRMAGGIARAVEKMAADLARATAERDVAREERNVERWKVRELTADLSTARAEIAEALTVLAPSMPESGLVDACKQIKQAAISESDNCNLLEQRICEEQERSYFSAWKREEDRAEKAEAKLAETRSLLSRVNADYIELRAVGEGPTTHMMNLAARATKAESRLADARLVLSELKANAEHCGEQVGQYLSIKGKAAWRRLEGV